MPTRAPRLFPAREEDVHPNGLFPGVSESSWTPLSFPEARLCAAVRARACVCALLCVHVRARAPAEALSQPSPRLALRGRLTCALLLVPLYALEPLEHAPQVGDSVLEGDALVLRRGCLPQDLPHVLLSGGLQPASTWRGLRVHVARPQGSRGQDRVVVPSPPLRKQELLLPL